MLRQRSPGLLDPIEHGVAIPTFARDSKTTKEIVSPRRQYTYPAGFKNTQSYLDVQGGRAVIHFETDTAEFILRYTSDWPELLLEHPDFSL
jgi:hypothetical protein